jgi:hypothetical protein
MVLCSLLEAIPRPAVVLIAAMVASCARGSPSDETRATSNDAPIQLDSARVAALAIAAVARPPDTLLEYRVIQFTSDSLGWVVSVVPQVRPNYADSIDVVGGGGLVRVWRGDSVTVLNRYR